MPPAFSSTRQAAALAVLLAILLALPAILAKSNGQKRSDIYPAIPLKYGPFPWIQQKIFLETNDVDIAFLGSSCIWCGVNAPYVQQQLSAKLGREAEVFTLGWPWAGFDALYFIARDLLDHRNVKMLVIYDEDRNTDAPHPQASRWFRIGNSSESLDGLDWSGKLSLYGSAVLGTPRTLLSLVRSNLTENLSQNRSNYWEIQYQAANLVEQRGSLRARLGFNNNRKKFSPDAPPSVATPDDAVIYTPENSDSFRFTERASRPYQLHFARKLAQLCRERGAQLVILHLPVLQEREQEKIPERVVWPDVLNAPADLVGIPGAKLFAEIPAADVPRFFYNKSHLNQNGQDLFTPLVAPALFKIYASTNF